MLRLGYKTAYLDESATIEHYAGLYVIYMKNIGIDASIYDCIAVQDESFWVRLRIQCDGAKTKIYMIGIWGQLINEYLKGSRKET